MRREHDTSADSNNNGRGVVVCQKCDSTRVEIIKRGFSRSIMFKTLANLAGLIAFMLVFLYIGVTLDLFAVKTMKGEWDRSAAVATKTIIWIVAIAALPLSLLFGYLGSNQLLRLCNDCGFKTPLKRARSKNI